MSEASESKELNAQRVGIARKIIVTATTGGIAYLITNLTNEEPIQNLTLSAFIGGVALVIQFLADFDVRLRSVERNQQDHESTMRELVRDGFSKINEATQLFGLVEESSVRADTIAQLVRNATKINAEDSPLIYDFVQLEIARTALLLQQLGGRVEVSCEGEDRDWLLGLTAIAREKIYATSYATLDAGSESFDDGFWATDLGQRYLQAQRDAVRRNVEVRRIFIFDRNESSNDPAFVATCRVQAEIGVEVRVQRHGEIPHPTIVPRDFILFDSVLSYESVASATRLTPDAQPSILNTHLVLEQERVRARVSDFDDLWAKAQPFETVSMS